MGTDKTAYSAGGRRGKPQRASTAEPRRDQFVRLELDKEQLLDYREWRQDIAAWSDVFQEMLEDGYKFTVRWDDYSSSPACFIFPSDDHDNSGYILSGRGGTPLNALTEGLYKHAVLLRGVWRPGVSGRPANDDPDW